MQNNMQNTFLQALTLLIFLHSEEDHNFQKKHDPSVICYHSPPRHRYTPILTRR